MKKLVLITGIILISCVLISSFAAPAAETGASVTSVSQEKKENAYVLRELSGRLAVFREGETEPFMVTETYVNTLPRADREKLKQGIKVQSKRELQRVLEDFCS